MVVALGSAPAFAGLGGWLVDRTKPGSTWAVATALAALGVALIDATQRSAAEVSEWCSRSEAKSCLACDRNVHSQG